tara:strand:+ start:4637 stop:4786 length:150 start_codon:yes stop_codon:yes gene_type:complete
VDGIIHFLKHLIGLCGEAHPSLIVSGGALFTAVGIYYKQILFYIKDLIS